MLTRANLIARCKELLASAGSNAMLTFVVPRQNRPKNGSFRVRFGNRYVSARVVGPGRWPGEWIVEARVEAILEAL